jgi:hypothetical protein
MICSSRSAHWGHHGAFQNCASRPKAHAAPNAIRSGIGENSIWAWINGRKRFFLKKEAKTFIY